MARSTSRWSMEHRRWVGTKYLARIVPILRSRSQNTYIAFKQRHPIHRRHGCEPSLARSAQPKT